MILYFSGTGNSKYIADIIADKLGESIYSINDGLKQGNYPDISADEVLIFSVPTYAWRIPRVVSEWIEKGGCFCAKKAYFIMTCGDDIGDAEKHLKELCDKNGLIFMGCAPVVMPENYIAMFDSPTKQREAEIIKTALSGVDALTAKLKSGAALESSKKSFADKIKSGIVNDLFYMFYISSKKFTASEKCIGCGKCEKLCPMNNITLENGKPKWHNNCTHCMACISYCPAECIEYGKVSVGKRRYRCEEYSY